MLLFFLPALLLTTPALFPQRRAVLIADGLTNTYTLITQVLAPGGNPIEVPDCSHPEFGPHITQVFDRDLGKYSFVFHIHVTLDNDRCINFDRQRNEIKTYDRSPNYLQGFLGDTVTFRWKFKLDTGFQASPLFTHIHQIKAADGDAAIPIITFTPRAGSPDQLEIIHVDSAGRRTVVATAALSLFRGVWVEAYEKITYGFPGKYSITLTKLTNKAVLLSFSSDSIDMWRSGTTMVRPKWGIYRSLLSPKVLRDEQVRFDQFCLVKGADDCRE